MRQGDYPLCVPRPAVGGIAGGCMSEEVALRYFFVLFQFVPTLSLVPSGRGKGACYGGVAPLRGPFPNPRITPPYLALRLCVRCPPVPTKASLSEQAGANIHPRMRGGMKSGQGIPLRAYPGPPPEGLPGCGHDLRTPEHPAGRYSGKGVGMTWGLGVPLHAIPWRQVRVFRKRSFCWNTRTPGGRGGAWCCSLWDQPASFRFLPFFP